MCKPYRARAAHANALTRIGSDPVGLDYDRTASSNRRFTSSQFTTFQKALT
jgi:hypothetical protein